MAWNILPELQTYENILVLITDLLFDKENYSVAADNYFPFLLTLNAAIIRSCSIGLLINKEKIPFNVILHRQVNAHYLKGKNSHT